MLPKKNRVDKRMVEKIFKEGKFFNSPLLTFKFILADQNSPARISFIVPKTISKKAVERNHLRRSGYNALKIFMPALPPGLAGVFIFKKPVYAVADLEKEIKIILNKIIL